MSVLGIRRGPLLEYHAHLTTEPSTLHPLLTRALCEIIHTTLTFVYVSPVTGGTEYLSHFLPFTVF